MRQLGVIGGLGPMATAYFMELVVKMTDAKTDQEHLNMIIYNRPSIPDRTDYILGKSTNDPSIPIIEIGKSLAAQNVACIAIPCITAHYFHDRLIQEISVPIIHIVKECVSYLKEYGIQKVGIMATDGTIKSALFQNELIKNGIAYCIPDNTHQGYVMDLIYQDVKADCPLELDKFNLVSKYLRKQGAEVILLGCTELSLIKKEQILEQGYLDAMEILAKKAIEICGVSLKGEYQCLIKKRE